MREFGWGAFGSDLPIVELGAGTKEAALRALLDALTEAGALSRDDVDALEGESSGTSDVWTTVTSKSVACTQVRSHRLSQERVVIGRSVLGLEFGASDGLPAHVVVLMVGRADPGVGPSWGLLTGIEHIRGVFGCLHVERFCSRVMAATGSSDVSEAVQECCVENLRNVLERTGLLIELQTTTLEGVLREIVEALAV